mmetsp:Transcript_30483/g.53310  ORF Transcript_30483/g.53310 Transcript_30483/m.53310 type:complete len:86 (-) Transcript_30483:300-557(-)
MLTFVTNTFRMCRKSPWKTGRPTIGPVSFERSVLSTPLLGQATYTSKRQRHLQVHHGGDFTVRGSSSWRTRVVRRTTSALVRREW